MTTRYGIYFTFEAFNKGAYLENDRIMKDGLFI
jgi:hypothetical protein